MVFDNAFGGTLKYCQYKCSKYCERCDYDMAKVNEKYCCKACYNCAQK